MKFRLPEINDKEIIKLYIEEHYSHNEKSISANNKLTSMSFEDWVKMIHNNVNIPNSEWGKSLTYLAFNDNNDLIGLLSVRYELSDEKAMQIGHIGYGVRPSQRRKGYATQMLKYGLEECKKHGLDKVIVGCYKENIGSAKTIIKNNGKLIKEEKLEKDINEFWKISLIDQFYEINL